MKCLFEFKITFSFMYLKHLSDGYLNTFEVILKTDNQSVFAYFTGHPTI